MSLPARGIKNNELHLVKPKMVVLPACPSFHCSSRGSRSAHHLHLLHLANRRGWRVHLGFAAAAANAAPQGSTYNAQDDSGPTPGTQVHNDEADSIAKCPNILRLYKLRDAKSGNWTQAHEITTGLLSAKAQNWMMMNAWPRDASLARSTTSTACAAQLVHPGATCTHGPKGRNDDSQDPQDNAGGANPLRSRGHSEASHGLLCEP